jgi:hypothetical protein
VRVFPGDRGATGYGFETARCVGGFRRERGENWFGRRCLILSCDYEELISERRRAYGAGLLQG